MDKVEAMERATAPTAPDAADRGARADFGDQADRAAGAGPASRPRSPALVRFYRRYATVLHTICTLILGAVIWQVVAWHSSKLVLVPLGDILHAFTASIRSGQLGTDAAASLQGFAEGFVLAAAAGIAVGVLMAVNRVIFDFLDPWMSALYSTPLIALAPLFIITFGIGMTSRIAVVLTMAFFPIALNTTAGIRMTDANLIETAHSYGANKFQIFRKVLLPSAVPFIVTGLRLAVGRGLMGVVVAEFFGSTTGLGHTVFTASQNFATADVWLGVFVLAVIGVVFIRIMHIIEKKIAPWRNSRQGGIL
ncbi:amino acid ABC transporter permease [Rugosimonospora africana]|uniref:Amino acid ABC transporter permease n=2 Tax=Rugosimonospora africana TaxID=556532 RepID=A0A8J3R408_9ACTN|nr:amino acid ABC transporter permease [Rugosimonospora africana]